MSTHPDSFDDSTSKRRDNSNNAISPLRGEATAVSDPPPGLARFGTWAHNDDSLSAARLRDILYRIRTGVYDHESCQLQVARLIRRELGERRAPS